MARMAMIMVIMAMLMAILAIRIASMALMMAIRMASMAMILARMALLIAIMAMIIAIMAIRMGIIMANMAMRIARMAMTNPTAVPNGNARKADFNAKTAIACQQQSSVMALKIAGTDQKVAKDLMRNCVNTIAHPISSSARAMDAAY